MTTIEKSQPSNLSPAEEKAAITSAIRSSAEKNGLDANLLLAIAKVESNFRVKAIRFERSYVHYFEPAKHAVSLNISLESETCLQKFSLGPLQVMGGTARWLGFKGPLTDLLSAGVGVAWGVEYFRRVCSKQIYVNDQIAVYNAGSVRKNTNGTYINQPYVDKVLAAYEQILLANNTKASHSN